MHNRGSKKDPAGMSLSETPCPIGQSRLLDEVRAKIFYLASDVEPASQPAAMLLRAVAESIDAPEMAGQLNGHVALTSVAASLGLSRTNGIRAATQRVPLHQHNGAESHRPGQKR